MNRQHDVQQPDAGIPVLDISGFDGRPGEFTRAVGRGYREFGFVGFVGHGLDDAVIRDAYAAFRKFFALPEATKQQYHLPGQGGARGYTGFGVEQAKDNTVPDLKEFWHVGREVAGGNSFPDALLPNVWPSEVPEFREAALALYNALDGMGRRVLSAIALDLDLPADWFDDKVNQGNSILRPIHYPPIEQAAEGQVRAARHEDINVITLLIGSEQDGLEILTRDGRWIPVSTIPGTVVVNIGDMLQRLTNHVLPSTTHRVVNPPGAAAKTSRYSIPFFLHFNPDFEIRTLPQCVSDDNPDRYPEPINSHDFLLQRVREINLL